MSDHEFMTTNEVAEACRTSAETCRYWRHVGKGPKSFKVGRRVLYAREDVEAFLTEARQQGSPAKQLPHHDVRLGRASVDPGPDLPRMAPGEYDPWGGEVYRVVRPELLGERIAQAIEAEAEHEGERAQRVLRMCARLAREIGSAGATS